MRSLPLKVFLSYSHKDADLHEQLCSHLAIFDKTGRIVFWDDRKIVGGENWRVEISTRLDDADIVLLELTHNFIASGYCWGIEMSRALELCQEKGTSVIPVYLRPCNLSWAPIAELQRVPRGDQAVSEHENYDAAFKTVADEIERVIDLLAGIDSEPRRSSAPEEIIRIFGDASRPLLEWPKEISGCWIERRELKDLQSVLDQEHSFTVLLGAPGSGKSALLARFATYLRKDVALLAIKADLLPKEVSTLDQLDGHFGAPAPLTHCVRQLAETRAVVLLIDQIDVLSELMDQHTSRLTVLLSLISRLRARGRVHIVLSCREFEYQHDVRLSSLGPVPVRLADPPWQAVEQVLGSAGIDAATLPDDARELLRRPQHLSVFVTHFSQCSPTPVFSSYHAMIDAALRDRVLHQRWGQSALDTLQDLAWQMASDEELWLPTARFQHKSADLDRLVSADILVRSPDSMRIAFRHQTVFDFVHARTFVTRVASLAEHVLARQDAIFVRPTIWSALPYMRGVDRATYRREFGALWANPRLRPHVRYLLIEFLGQIQDPDLTEVDWLLAALKDPKLRAKAARAVAGNPQWFRKLREGLRVAMAGDPESAWDAAWILRPALSFDRNAVLDLLESLWLPDESRDRLTLRTLWDLTAWDERAICLVEVIARRTPNQTDVLRQITGAASKSCPSLAPRIVAAELWGTLRAVEAEANQAPSPPPDTAPDREKLIYEFKYGRDSVRTAVERMVEDDARWYGMKTAVDADPGAFVRHVWPWLQHVSLKYVNAAASPVRAYRRDGIFEKSGNHNVTGALEVAVRAFASSDPEGFLSFLEENQGSDLQTLHRLLASGLAALPASCANSVKEYILEDDRRLALGPYSNVHQESCELIRTVAPHLSELARLAIEHQVLTWDYLMPDPGSLDDEDRSRWNRQHRLRLLRAFPLECLAFSTRRFRDEEEAALPQTPDWDYGPVKVGHVVSPVSQAEMQMASDGDLIETLSALGHLEATRRDDFKGGRIEASRELGAYAKTDPTRALNLIRLLPPGQDEIYACEALRAIAEAHSGLAADVIQAIQELDLRGFRSQEFRSRAADCLGRVAPIVGGLDKTLCALMEGWLRDELNRDEPNINDAEESPSDAAEDDEDITGLGSKEPKLRSVLLGPRHRALPAGNYPILAALFLGYLTRTPPDPDGWLAVLERHLGRREHPRVWAALASHELTFLNGADRPRAVDLIQTVLEKFPGVLDSDDWVYFIAMARHWLPLSTIHSCIARWERSVWKNGPMAAAEVAMLQYAQYRDDETCRTVVNRVLGGGEQSGEKRAAMRFGVASMAANLWPNSWARRTATPVLLALLERSDAEVARAWCSLFRSGEPFLADQHTEQILDGLIAYPQVLQHTQSGYVARKMKELLQGGFDPRRVCRVVSGFLETGGPATADLPTPWSTSAKDLTDIALTLQRLPETRVCGLEVFERLLDLNTSKTVDMLKEFDQRRSLPAETL